MAVPSSSSAKLKITDLTYRFEQETNRTDQMTPAQLVEFALKLDPLRTLAVREDADAHAIAGAVDAGSISHILVHGTQNQVVGVIDVDWAREKAEKVWNEPLSNFTDTVAAIFSRPDANGKFHHEWLTADRPPIIWCCGGHYVNQTCTKHKC